MATKLKNLSVTSVDLVDQGANPDAHIRLFKRRDEPEAASAGEPGAETAADPDAGLFQKFVGWLTKGLSAAWEQEGEPKEEAPEGGVAKDAQTFSENISRELLRSITSEMYDCCYALSDSLCSIICDQTLTAQSKQALMLQSLDEFAQTVRGATGNWAQGQKMQTAQEAEAGIQKSQGQQEGLAKLLDTYGIGDEPSRDGTQDTGEIAKEETDTMNIDKSKMTPEELAVLEGFEKKYGTSDTGAGTGAGAGAEGQPQGAAATVTPDGGVAKAAETGAAQTTDLHPEVQKALADFQELTKRQAAEVEELKKSLEIERLTMVAKKYEVLGKKPDELAKKLYDLKKAGSTVYDDYVALLDENLTTLNKSGLFGEIGSNNSGSAGTEQTIGIKAAELAKSVTGGMTSAEAIVKAWEENPELAAQYEAEYMGR